MKKIMTTFACLMVISQSIWATKISIVTSGFTYSPATVSASIGDTISIAGSTTHPLVQVDQATWNANSSIALSGGWGTKTITYTFTITSSNTIYYVCANHVASMGMKGQINISATGIKQVTANADNYKVNIFPNPVVNGEFTVKVENNSVNGKVSIYNIEGRLLETYNLTAGVAEIKTKLPEGSYLYSVTINQKEISRNKFLITDK